MKPEAIPFYGVGVALALAAVWFFFSYDGYTFEDPEARQFCAPQVQTDSFRWGRLASTLEVEDVEPLMLVRYKTPRSIQEVTSRVYATQGQRVRIEGGKVIVDGKKVDDPYARRPAKDDVFPELIVPAGCLFVLNDSRNWGGGDRKDSRAFGPIPFRAVTYVFSAKEPETGRGRGRR